MCVYVHIYIAFVKVMIIHCRLISDIHYFHCLRIVEILKGTEASSKNIFGRYSSQRMKVSRHVSAHSGIWTDSVLLSSN